MRTIEERAFDYAPGNTNLQDNCRFAYIRGATEQRNIDFENAWVAYCACCYCGCEINPDKCEKITDGASFGACITYDKFYSECYLYLNLIKWTISIGYFTV